MIHEDFIDDFEQESFDEEIESLDINEETENEEVLVKEEHSSNKSKHKQTGIKDRKKKELTLFDVSSEKSKEEKLIEWGIKHGSGFVDGRLRIYYEYHKNPTISDFAKFIKDEIPGANGELPNEKLSYELLRLFMGMNDCMNRVTVAKQLFMANERRRDGNELFTLEDDRIFRKYTDDASQVYKSYEKAYPNFFNTLVEDVNSQDQSYLLNLYGVLKDLLDQRK